VGHRSYLTPSGRCEDEPPVEGRRSFVIGYDPSRIAPEQGRSGRLLARPRRSAVMLSLRRQTALLAGRTALRPTPNRLVRRISSQARRDGQPSPFIGQLSNPRLSRRDNAAAAALRPAPSSTLPIFTPHPVHTSSSIAEDDSLKAHFDVPYHPTLPGVSEGLFRFPPLTSPSHLPRLAERTLIQASAIVRRIVAAPSDSTGRELRLVVKNLDRLSDVLCGVIDMCELVRNVHPEEEWVVQSDLVYERLCSFMNELNTNRGLYEVSSV
jgi:intermediate peptidase